MSQASGPPVSLDVDSSRRIRELELALSSSEERFRKTFGASPDSITITDMQTSTYVDVNDGFTRSFGYSREEIVGRNAFDIGIWAYPQDRANLVQALREQGHVKDYHAVGRSKDGTLHTCSISGEVVDMAGRASLVLVVRDITEQLHTERALREALERFSRAFRASPDALTLFDLQTGQLVEINDGFVRLYGAPREAIIGRTCAELRLYCVEAERERIMDLLRNEGSVRDVEVRIRRSDGTERVCVFSGELLEIEGRDHCVVIIRDMTEQRRAAADRALLEEQLRQAQKLEALGTLAGGIAHDFNNILTAIMAYSEMAVMDAEYPAEVRSNLLEVNKASLRARDLVRQILSFSRMKKAERRPVKIAEVILEAVSLLRSSLPSTIQITLEGLADEDAVVLADPGQVHQVIMNLGTNATHAMRGRQGVLGFKLSKEESEDLSLDGARPARVCIEVSDTGHGMSPEVLAHLFEPFYTTKPQGEGTGLGLSVVHGIVQYHGGTICVDSHVGLGTKIRIVLPLHDGAQPSLEPPTAGLPLGRGERVLFIDDEPQICRFAQKILPRLGYQVSTCTNPLEALELLVPDQCRFNLVVTDLTMPNLTGLELAHRIRSVHPRLPILLTSGLPGGWTAERLEQVGVNGLLTKPINVQSLAGAVRRVLDAAAASIES